MVPVSIPMVHESQAYLFFFFLADNHQKEAYFAFVTWITFCQLEQYHICMQQVENILL